MALSVHLLDPSNFTPHYCIGLGNGLHDIGIETHLWSSEWPYEDLRIYAQRFERHNVFFHLSQIELIRDGGNTVRRLLKGIEYGFGLRTVLAALRHSRENSILHVQWIVVPQIDRWFWNQVKTLNIPIVYTAHNVLPHNHTSSDVPRYRWFYQRADRIIVHSPANRAEMVTYFPEVKQKVLIVPFGEFSSFLNAFPQVSQAAARAQFGLQPQDQVVLFFGLISPYKGLGFLIDAVGYLKEELPNLKLIIAGNCRESFSGYNTRIQETGITDRVLTHLHHVPTSQNSRYFSACDVCVLPYISASQSMTLFMAFANQKPVIVTHTGGLPDVVKEGKSGFIVRPESARALAEALKRFFALPLAEQSAMGSCGKQKVDEEFNWQSIGKTTRAIYQELTGATQV